MIDFQTIEYGPVSNSPQKLVFMFHGYGRNAWFMDKVGKELGNAYPSTKIYGIHAPEKLTLPKRLDVSEMNMPEELLEDDGTLHDDMQRQWFSLEGGFIFIWWRMWKLMPKINDFVDSVMSTYSLQPSDIAYVGFSQGGAIALYSALRRRQSIASVVAHSTAYWGKMPVRSKPPVYFLYGDQDASLSQELYDKSIQRLRNTGCDIKVEELIGQGHYISSKSRQKMTAFLKPCLK